jgi:hypothetical protein
LNTTAFATDGTRFAAWERRGRTGIVVLDTRTGHPREINDGCGLESEGRAGRFLVGCSSQQQALLNARTGGLRLLPKPPPHSYGEYGPIWEAVGLRYVMGDAGLHARCHRTQRHEGCTVLLDLATGAMSKFPESQVRDIDRPGAPLVCPALRRKLFLWEKSDFAEEFSYAGGLLAEPERFGEAPVRHVRIDGCHGDPLLLPTSPLPLNLQLAGGLLTWDTGHWASEFENGLVEGPRAGRELRHGTLFSYNLHTGRRRTWALPLLPLHVLGREFSSISGVFGYSAHTDYNVFWVATQSIDCGGEKGLCSAGEPSAIYVAPLR